MNKNAVMSVALTLLSLLIIVGVGLTTYFLLHSERDADLIRLDLENEESQEIVFRALTLLPGGSRTYTLSLFCEVADEYDVTLQFSETEDRALKDYVYAKIEVGGETLCDRLLSDLFGEGATVFPCAFGSGESVDVKITYYMPEEVGNEAQNAEVDFELLITASNAGDFYE